MELRGYSGCQLYIVDYNGVSRVKKKSSDLEYNGRLRKQKEKQEKTDLKGFHKCSVYSEGEEDGLYYFVMEYINGNTLSEKMFFLELDKIKEFTERISQNMTEFASFNKEANIVFDEKIYFLKKVISNQNSYYLDKSFKMLDQFNWEYVIPSPCHGDLTLENILVQSEKMYLIDCLDSFYDSWLIDVAKILQDVDVMWSYRKYKQLSNNLIIRLTIMRDLLIEKIKGMDSGEHLIETIYYILLLNLLRIYPYVKDDETLIFLNEKLEYVINKIECKSWRE